MERSSSQQTEKAASVSGFIPMEFKKAVAFFQSRLPAAGYQFLEGDAEMDEAESTFSGHGFHGKRMVNGILNCPGAATLRVAVSSGCNLCKMLIDLKSRDWMESAWPLF